MSVVILAHEQFPDRAKTAVGMLRFGDRDVVAVLDQNRAGDRVRDHVPDVQDAPIVASMADAPECDELVIGIAPIGGGFEESWRPDVRTALERGCDVTAGLHYFLNEDPEFVELAAEYGCELTDIRRPPEDLTVAEGVAGDVDARVIATMGTDCSTGKMTTSYALRDAARDHGVDAAVVPTGQTGILIDGGGIAIDRVISDFAAGAVERMLLERDDHDLLIVEGQGSLFHPAYSGVTLSILHGSQADGLVLCHEAGRDRVHSYEDYSIPPVGEYAALYEQMAAPVRETAVIAGCLNTSQLTPDAAAEAISEYAAALGVPTADPVRDPEPVVDAVLGR